MHIVSESNGIILRYAAKECSKKLGVNFAPSISEYHIMLKVARRKSCSENATHVTSSSDLAPIVPKYVA